MIITMSIVWEVYAIIKIGLEIYLIVIAVITRG